MVKVFPSKVCHFQCDPRLRRNGEHYNVQGGTSAKTYEIYIVRIVFLLAFFQAA